MSDGPTSQITSALQGAETLSLSGWRKAIAEIALQVGTATTLGVQRCFQENSAATQSIEALSESSTQFRKVSPEIRAKLDSILDAARRDIIEDGKSNAITQRLAELFVRDYEAAITAITPIIEGGSTPPIIAAEILKEIGRIRDAASHGNRCWLLAYALNASSPFVRDGAGLGLARLADPAALHYLRRAIEREENAELRADLQLVVDELVELNR